MEKQTTNVQPSRSSDPSQNQGAEDTAPLQGPLPEENAPVSDVASEKQAPPAPIPLPGAYPLLLAAWDTYRAQWRTFIGIMAAPVLLAAVLEGMQYTSLALGWTESSVIGIMLLAGWLAAFLVNAWAHTAVLVTLSDRDQPQRVGRAYARASAKVFSYVWIGILIALAVSAGTALFIIPGIIATVWFSLSIYAFAGEDKRGLAALRASRAYVRGRWWGIFGRIAVVMLLSGLFYFLAGLAAMFLLGGANGAPERIVDLGTALIASALVTPFALSYGYQLYTSVREGAGDRMV